MTPATPPAIPSDIPRETWNLAARIWAEMLTVEVNSRAEWCEGDVEAIAREILAAQERGKLMERERAIAACERQKADFLSTEYAFNQPLGSLLERFACDECIEAIREGAE